MDKHGGERERACGAESSHGAPAAEVARLRADKAALLAALRDLLGGPDLIPSAWAPYTHKVERLTCHHCRRDYSDPVPNGHLCTSDDCPGYQARAAIAAAEQV